MNKKEQEKAKYKGYLEDYMSRTDRIGTYVTRVSPSGMSRNILCLIKTDNGVYNLSYDIAKALGWRYSESTRSVIVEGCGMDMGFHVVSCVSSLLYGHDKYDQIKQYWI